MRRLFVACLLAVLVPLAARAGTITVMTPAGVLNNPALPGPTVTLNDAFAFDTWLRVNVRNGSSIGITGDYPRSGNGSAYFTGATGQSKADFEYFFDDLTGKTLGNLTSLGYDYYRDAASTNPNNQAPALRIYIDADGSVATTNDRGYLIYEPVYNGTAVVPTDSWVTENITAASNLWLRQFTPGQTLEVYNITLGQWQAGGVDTSANPAVVIAPGPNSIVFGLSTGTGSGWNGAYAMGVDNVRIGFGSAGLADPAVYNFELQSSAQVVPAPPAALLALLGMGSVGVVRRFRRKAA